MNEEINGNVSMTQQESVSGTQQETDPALEKETNRVNDPIQDHTSEETAHEEKLRSDTVNPRIPLWIIAFSIMVIILDVFGMIGFPKLLKEYRNYKLAEQRIANSETSLALNDLYAVAQNHSNSMPVMVKLVELSMENGYYDMAGYIIDNYIAGKSLSDTEYDKIDSYYTKLENYYSAYDAVDKIFNEVNTDLSAEEQSDQITEKLKSNLHQDGMDDAYISYYLGYVATDNKNAINYMQDCYEIDPECMDVRTQLSLLYRRSGDFITARKFADEALLKDKTDSETLRSMAIIEMLDNNLKQGLQYAMEAYTYNPDGTYIRETYLIALNSNGETEQVQRIKDEMAKKGESLEEDTEQLLKGNITLEQYYIGE